MPGVSLLESLEDEPPIKAARNERASHRVGGPERHPPTKAEILGPQAQELRVTWRARERELLEVRRMDRISPAHSADWQNLANDLLAAYEELADLSRRCGLPPDETPHPLLKQPMPSTSAAPVDVAAAAAAAALAVVPAEADALNEEPLVLLVDGFADKRVNGPYMRNGQEQVGGHPTYWSSDGSLFMFFSQAGRGRWQVSLSEDVGGPDGGPVDMLEEVRATPADQHPRSLAVQVSGLLWSEYADAEWRDVRIRISRPVEPEGFMIQGFTDRQLDGVYLKRDEQVGGMSTYWSNDHAFFLYVEKESGRWQLSPRWEQPAPGAATPTAGGLVDLLAKARQGGSPGLGMQVDGNIWTEYDENKQEWQDVQLDFTEISSRDQLPPMRPPPAPAPMLALPAPGAKWAGSHNSGLKSLVRPPAPVLGAPVGQAYGAVTPPQMSPPTTLPPQMSPPTSLPPQAVPSHHRAGATALDEDMVLDPADPGLSEAAARARAEEKAKQKEEAERRRREEEERQKEREALLARLPPEGEVPAFDEAAAGTPHDWNYKQTSWCWGKRTRRFFPPVEGAKVDARKVMKFLNMRVSKDGRPLNTLVGPPQIQEGGWFRCTWNAFSEDLLPETTPGEWGGGKSDWQRAWHGCKFEALYSIMYHGRLAASCNAERGDRFWEKAPGVYVHKDNTKEKVHFYSRWVPLCRDGVFWSAKWEVRVDRSDRIPMSRQRTDQWVQHERSVHLVALWFCGRTYDDMDEGNEVQEAWDPLLEANPRSERFSKGPPPADPPRDDGIDQELDFLLDNCNLQATSVGVQYRRSKNNEDRDDKDPAAWSSTVRGLDEGDGWLNVAGRYLPMVVNGARILFPKANYVLDNTRLQAQTDGIFFRRSKSLEDKDLHDSLAWGQVVGGADVGDGWFSAGGRYLPLAVDGVPILLQVQPPQRGPRVDPPAGMDLDQAQEDQVQPVHMPRADPEPGLQQRRQPPDDSFRVMAMQRLEQSVVTEAQLAEIGRFCRDLGLGREVELSLRLMDPDGLEQMLAAQSELRAKLTALGADPALRSQKMCWLVEKVDSNVKALVDAAMALEAEGVQLP